MGNIEKEKASYLASAGIYPALEKPYKWRVGMVGLGKLGLPVALAMSLKGHDVMGYDINPERMQKERFSEREQGPAGEPSIEPLLRESSLKFVPLGEVVRHAEILFVAVQTPHEPRFEGVTRLPLERADFDYSYLKAALSAVSGAVETVGEPRVVVVISTVLPGTIRREILPELSPLVRLCYNPFFIAMGTTIRDFLAPEFVLFGADDDRAAEVAGGFYKTLHRRPFFKTSIENAELIKVAYNTYISMKICFSNTLMEICHKTPGADVDAVTGALKLANDRLISTKYMDAGMGDGGGCHPRDGIALSWLAGRLNLSFDWFEGVMVCRERQADWLAWLARAAALRRGDSKVYVLGKSFKPETNLTVGSPATLVANLLREKGLEVFQWDPQIDPPTLFEPGVFLVATKHEAFRKLVFPAGSVVIDPFRYITPREGVEVVSVGRGKRLSKENFNNAIHERRCNTRAAQVDSGKPAGRVI